MPARLTGTAGTPVGMEVPLVDAQLSIGREAGNALRIDHQSVSMRHCILSKDGRRFRIRDLTGHGETRVNGLPVNERLLHDGDEISIGDCGFIFLNETTELPKAGEAWANEPGRVDAGRAARDLNVLLRISSTAASFPGFDALQQDLMDSILEIVPADRGVIILAGRHPGELISLFGRDRTPGVERPTAMSRFVIDRVLGGRASVLLHAGMPELEPPLTTVLAVPLVVPDRVAGVIYLDSSDPAIRFDAHHLNVMTGIAGFAALALRHSREVEMLARENRRLQAQLHIEHNMIGESPCLREVYRFISRVAPADSTVLIRGESGTGKELAARAIHRNSPRAQRPFLAINCAVLTETLLESELFGHEKGAFTGAYIQKKGRLEEAEGGSLFLDEVGELAPAIQSKLLRVLQEREFERVGGSRTLHVDIRLIAATNRDLEQAVRKGLFRQDLYYRLNVVSMTMPPLRQRREDIPLLAEHFARRHGSHIGRRLTGISERAHQCLIAYDWPGNVRELENAIERAVVLGSTEIILPEDLPDPIMDSARVSDTAEFGFHQAIREAKKTLVLKTLAQTGGNHMQAARLLGLHPNNLHRLIRSLNLRPASRK